ncbi:hypothetical protein L1887_30987 [Cichorium endivia]|nr:hypothetical protein L1887_30987 [Cichorium endivia]
MSSNPRVQTSNLNYYLSTCQFNNKEYFKKISETSVSTKLDELKKKFSQELQVLKDASSNLSNSVTKIDKEVKLAREPYEDDTHMSLKATQKLVDEAKDCEVDIRAYLLKIQDHLKYLDLLIKVCDMNQLVTYYNE